MSPTLGDNANKKCATLNDICESMKQQLLVSGQGENHIKMLLYYIKQKVLSRWICIISKRLQKTSVLVNFWWLIFHLADEIWYSTIMASSADEKIDFFAMIYYQNNIEYN